MRSSETKRRISILLAVFPLIPLCINSVSGCASSSKALEHSNYRPSEIEIDRRYTKYEAIDKGKLSKVPKLVHYERPDYPRLARQAGIEGTVAIAVIIGIDGKVEDARLIATDITPSMERSALNAARKFIYRPGERRSKAVRCRGMHVIRFALDDVIRKDLD